MLPFKPRKMASKTYENLTLELARMRCKNVKYLTDIKYVKDLMQVEDSQFTPDEKLLSALYNRYMKLLPPKPERESAIQKKVCDYARSKGVKIYRIKDADAPDRLFMFPDGHHCFIEFKKPGGKPRPRQVQEHENLRKVMQMVKVIDNEREGLDYINWRTG